MKSQLNIRYALITCAFLLIGFMANSQWQLTGNAGTNPATNFVGTIDNKPLVFRVNNKEVVRFKTGGRIDITNSTNTVYLGKNAGSSNQAAGNVFVGYEAAKNNDAGDYNVAVGYNAMYNCTGYGDHNVAVGTNALLSAVNGQSVFNTALGADVLTSNSYGVSNTSTGYYSMYANTTGSFNTANGQWALLSNTTGGSNTAIGEYAAGSNQSGDNNLALGSRSLLGNQTGSLNIAIGSHALASSVANGNNLAIGDSALGKYNDGSFTDYIVAVGSKALLNNTTGYYNTALGSSTLQTLTTGHSNTAIGFGANVASSNLYNTTSLGRGAVATASNMIMLGNSAVTVVRTYGAIIYPSDGRFKTNIKNNVPGLDFINALQPVTYNFDMHKLDNYTGADKLENDARLKSFDENARTAKEKKIYSGFIAQDVQKAAEKLSYDFSGVYKPQSDKDIYGLSYSDFVVPLVKAVQQLSQQNDDLKKEYENKIDDLQQQINQLKTLIAGNSMQSSQQNLSKTETVTASALAQNTPNPFRASTNISYTLPARYSNAQIAISDYTGKPIKIQMLNGSGKGNYNFSAAGLSAGTYNYSLYVDGKLTASKQMIIQ